MRHFPYILLLPLLVELHQPIHASAQSITIQQDKSFQFCFWPCAGSILQSSTSALSDIQETWHRSGLITFFGKNLQTITNIHSLDKFTRVLSVSSPECVEADPVFMDYLIKEQHQTYVPIFQVAADQESQEPSLAGEIVFLDRTDQWKGNMGVIHPHYGIGGYYQIEYWKKKTKSDPKIVAFYSSNETLNHLFVGSIQAAAIPVGDLERYLEAHDRLDLLERVIRFQIPQKGSPPAIYIGKELYENLLKRTLIAETWLRDYFHPFLMPVSFIK